MLVLPDYRTTAGGGGGGGGPATPTLESHAAAVDQAGATSIAVTKPTGLANGDIVLVWAGQDQSLGALTGPSGFTELQNVSTTVGRDMKVYLGYKVITDASSEPASYTVTSTDTNEWCIFAARISGVDNTTPIDATTPTPVAQASATPPSVAITTATDNALVVRLISATDNNVSVPDQALTAPSSPSGAGSYVGASVAGAGDMVVGAQWFNLATAGSSGTDAWTAAASGGVSYCATVAFRPDPDGGGGGGGGPYTIYIASSTSGSPTSAEVELHDILEAGGHTVGYHDHSNATLPGDCELLLFSPENVYTATFDMWTIAVPVMDMAMNSIYVRGLLPWDNDTVTRFEASGYWGQLVRFTDDAVLDGWPEAEGTVDILTADAWTNGVPTRAAVNHSTANDAQFFLSMGDDGDDSSAMGFYLPAGSTVTEPDDNAANEVQHTSTENYIALFLPTAYFTTGLTTEGQDLILACVEKVMS